MTTMMKVIRAHVYEAGAIRSNEQMMLFKMDIVDNDERIKMVISNDCYEAIDTRSISYARDNVDDGSFNSDGLNDGNVSPNHNDNSKINSTQYMASASSISDADHDNNDDDDGKEFDERSKQAERNRDDYQIRSRNQQQQTQDLFPSPLRLLLLDIDHDTFNIIKSEQSILVGFEAFPRSIMQLLDKCDEDGKDKSKQNTTSYFSCVIESKAVNGNEVFVFKIVETNLFKQLVHLSLTFSVANKDEIIDFVVERVKINRWKKERADKMIDKLENKRAEDKKLITDLNEQISSMKYEHEQMMERMMNENKQEIEKLKESNAVAINELTRDYEIRLSNAEKDKEQQIRDMEENMRHIKIENDKILDEKREIESAKQEAEMKINALTKSNQSYIQEIDDIRAKNRTLHDTIAALERTQADSYAKINSLETQMLSKQDIISTMQDQSKQLEDRIRNLETIAANAQTNVSELQRKNDISAEESVKRGDMIKALTSELNQTKNKMKKKNALILTQEKLISTTMSALDEQLQEVSCQIYLQMYLCINSLLFVILTDTLQMHTLIHINIFN